jgi:uncharacterized DUF497 family protein
MQPLASQIDALDWDDWNRDHIKKHGVSISEIEEVIWGGRALARGSYKERLAITGPSAAGRMYTVIVGESPQVPNLYYVFSARPASRVERREYEEYRSGEVT